MALGAFRIGGLNRNTTHSFEDNQKWIVLTWSTDVVSVSTRHCDVCATLPACLELSAKRKTHNLVSVHINSRDSQEFTWKPLLCCKLNHPCIQGGKIGLPNDQYSGITVEIEFDQVFIDLD
jgi:hypothetical protein